MHTYYLKDGTAVYDANNAPEDFLVSVIEEHLGRDLAELTREYVCNALIDVIYDLYEKCNHPVSELQANMPEEDELESASEAVKDYLKDVEKLLENLDEFLEKIARLL